MDVQRELSLINKHIRHHHTEAGETIYWYEQLPFDVAGGSTYDDVYDEGNFTGAGRKYKPAVLLPTIYVEEIEDESRAIEEGRQPTQNMRITMLFRDLVEAGIEDPEEYRPHLNDMFMYDNRYYNVYRYKARGRLREEVIVAVEGVEVYVEQELVLDLPPVYSPDVDLPWPATLP
jgi:hypothetical protein